jgi:hypothetical protein
MSGVLLERCYRRACRAPLPATGMPFKIKLVGSEGRWRWIFRHAVQFFVAFGGFRKHDPENYIPLCDECGRELVSLISQWLRIPEKDTKEILGYKN